MNRYLIKEFGMVCGPDSILVACRDGIYRLYCPFKAKCIVSVGSHTIGEVVKVIEVKMSPDYKLVYIIQGKGYYHSSFIILSKPDTIQATYN